MFRVGEKVLFFFIGVFLNTKVYFAVCRKMKKNLLKCRSQEILFFLGVDVCRDRSINIFLEKYNFQHIFRGHEAQKSGVVCVYLSVLLFVCLSVCDDIVFLSV